MKVLHINTYNSGGAANAAIRLHSGLINEGVESSFLSLYSVEKEIENSATFQEVKVSPLRKILNRLGIPTTKAQKNWQRIKGKTGQYEMISFSNTDYNILEHPLYKKADLINLHFVSNFVDIPTFLNGNQKPIVWTLHDLNPFVGLFHYQEDRNSNKVQFEQLDKEEQEIKEIAIQNAKSLEVIGPSDWITNLAQTSNAFRQHKCHHIYNSIDTNIFKIRHVKELRTKHKLPLDKKILLFVSENLNNRRKGFKLLIESIKQINDPNILFLAVGKGFPKGAIQSNLKVLGPINGAEKMAELFSLSDGFLLPSTEDNLPNTMLESLCCGTPVIAFPIGGIPNVVNRETNGLLAKNVSVEELFAVIVKFIQTENFDREKISEQACSIFKLEVQAKKYIQVYNTLINE